MSKSNRQLPAGNNSRKAKGNYIIYGVVYLILLTTIALIVVVKQLPQIEQETVPKAVEVNSASTVILTNSIISDPGSTELENKAISSQIQNQNKPQQYSSLRGLQPPNQQPPLHGTKDMEAKAPIQVISTKESLPVKNLDVFSHQGLSTNYLGISTLLLIIASNRPDYLKKTLGHVLQYHPHSSVPILISQDGNHDRVNEVVDNAKSEFEKSSMLSFDHIHFDSHTFYENGYFRLADHFKFALSSAFSGRFGDIKRVIILEEDLQIAPDFFEFFAAAAPILDRESSLLTISAWNDNGFKSQVKDETALYRSDFFPGLGWMMTKKLWEELGPKWPRAYWDDWLREPKQRQGRQILRPEVCRTLHFGVRGVSNAQYSDYLNQIRLNDKFVPFTTMDISYLTESKWDDYYISSIVAAPELSMEEADRRIQNPSSLSSDERAYGIRLRYSSLDENSHARDSFSTLAKWSGAMNNVKAMVPRTAYKGIVSIYKNGVKVHLVPSNF